MKRMPGICAAASASFRSTVHSTAWN